MNPQKEKIGVLLMAYGCPDNLEDVEAYYTHIRRGIKPSPEQVLKLKGRYRRIGGRSPLLEVTREQARELEKRLNGVGAIHALPAGRQELPLQNHGFKIYLGMKHWHPHIEKTVSEMVTDGIEKGIGLVLSPHYSRISTEGYIAAVKKALQNVGDPESSSGRELSLPEFSFIESWHGHTLYIKALTEKIRKATMLFPDESRSRIVVLFTAHSLPEKILEWNDPYPGELRKTCELITRDLQLTPLSIPPFKRGENKGGWSFAYQSASHTEEKWLGPDILEELERLAGEGHRNILIVPIGFVSDHLEILYDIDVECMEFAKSREIALQRTESLNSSPLFIDALADIVRKAVK
jgi:ferrochelatase